MAYPSLNAPLDAARIAALCGGKHYGADFCALTVSTDSRKLPPGALFVALKGKNFDGADYLEAAKARGAVAAIVEARRDTGLPQIVVKDSLAALTALARDRRERSHATFIAITGSNGKTTSKEILQRLLQQQGQTLATQGNLNNAIGVPLTLLRLTDEDRYAVIEIGANHPGEIAPLTTLVRPDIAVITNTSVAHLAGFGSLEGVISAKSEIYAASNGALVINLNAPAGKRWRDEYQHRPQKRFALDAQRGADLYASDISDDGRHFTLHIDNAAYPVAWQLVGRHNIANALAAAAAATLAGISGAHIQAALHGLVLHQSRLAAYRVGPHTIYDDTYNANPASFKAGIDVIASAPHSLVIAGAMGELGERAAALHREVAAYAAEKAIGAFWAVGDGLAREYPATYTAARQGDGDWGDDDAISDDSNARHYPDTAAAGLALKQLLANPATPPTTVLVKGSRAAKMEGVLDAAAIDRTHPQD